MSILDDAWDAVTGADWSGFVQAGLPALLDMPTEGVTPSNVPGGTSPQFTETTPPVNATPRQAIPGAGASNWQTPLMIVGGVIAAVLLVKAVK